jgi:hypothetical protein
MINHQKICGSAQQTSKLHRSIWLHFLNVTVVVVVVEITNGKSLAATTIRFA